MEIHILVKDYGRDGFTVHGVTDKDEIADTWECASPECRRVVVDMESSVDPSAIPMAERMSER